MLTTRIVQLTCVLIAIVVGFVYYDDVSSDDLSIERHFSDALRAWKTRGKYMTYKNAHQIFYIAEHLTNPLTQQVDDDLEDHTVLFLHGFPTSSFDFARVWKQFASPDSALRARLNVTLLLTFDYLGYGFSDKPFADYADQYSIFDMADMVDKLLLHLNVRRVTLGDVSMITLQTVS